MSTQFTVSKGIHLGFRILPEDPKNGKFCHDGFTGPCRSPDENISILVVKRVEDLRLNGVKVGKLVQLLEHDVLQGMFGERAKVEQLYKKMMKFKKHVFKN